MLYLVDTGCNTNVVSKWVINCLPRHIQNNKWNATLNGQMADGPRLPFYRVVQKPTRIRDVRLEEIFVVS